MIFQTQIYSLIHSGKKKREIFAELSNLLDTHAKEIFLCDFDDTITTPGISTEAYYRGYCFASRIHLARHPFTSLTVSVSEEFLHTVPENTDIVIITRNFLSLVLGYSTFLGPILEQHGIRIVGIIGKVPDTSLSLVTSADKVILMGRQRKLLTDIFEYGTLRHQERCIFLPKPFFGTYIIVMIRHRWIKIRDFFRGFMSAFFGNKISKSY